MVKHLLRDARKPLFGPTRNERWLRRREVYLPKGVPFTALGWGGFYPTFPSIHINVIMA